MNRLIVEEDSVGVFTVRTQALAMICSHNHGGIVVKLRRLNRREQFAQRRVGCCYSAVV